MVDHCGCDGKAQRLSNESQQHPWLCLITVRALPRSGNRCALASKVSFREWFKGIFMTAIFHRRFFFPPFSLWKRGGREGEKKTKNRKRLREEGESAGDWRGLSGIIQFDWNLAVLLLFCVRHRESKSRCWKLSSSLFFFFCFFFSFFLFFFLFAPQVQRPEVEPWPILKRRSRFTS